MSRGLEDFEELKKTTCFYCQYHINEECVNDKCIWHNVEKDLKRLEELEKAFDSLSKENEKIMKELSKEIEKNRAFEIIKKRLPPLMRSSLLDYCNKEEYDLLKEAGL